MLPSSKPEENEEDKWLAEGRGARSTNYILKLRNPQVIQDTISNKKSLFHIHKERQNKEGSISWEENEI